MSMYIKRKVVRLPFPKEVLEKVGETHPLDCENYLQEKFGDYWFDRKRGTGFDIECTDESYYLDYVVQHETDEVGEYGFAAYLTDKDNEKYKQLFDLGGFVYNISDLRKVVFCYYNCSECPDYYEPNKNQTELDF